MRKPNFFIVGAPKSGTTALSTYLKTHPEVCFSEGKEPNYFCDDFADMCFSGSEEQYTNKFFSHCRCEHKAIGEGSVWYLYSQNAVKNIIKYDRNARIIVMLRNPVDMIYSLHSQLLYNRVEDVDDFEKAWFLQSSRASGKNIPKGCSDARFLLYREVGRLGEQLKRLYELVPKEQVMVILFDDFIRQTQQVYVEVLCFLKISLDYHPKFEKINENKVRKYAWLADFTQNPPSLLVSLSQRLKKLLGINRWPLLPFITRINMMKQPRPPLSQEMRKILIETFRNDIDELSRVLQRDLGRWVR
jgi:hypothetical protein